MVRCISRHIEPIQHEANTECHASVEGIDEYRTHRVHTRDRYSRQSSDLHVTSLSGQCQQRRARNGNGRPDTHGRMALGAIRMHEILEVARRKVHLQRSQPEEHAQANRELVRQVRETCRKRTTRRSCHTDTAQVSGPHLENLSCQGRNDCGALSLS